MIQESNDNTTENGAGMTRRAMLGGLMTAAVAAAVSDFSAPAAAQEQATAPREDAPDSVPVAAPVSRLFHTATLLLDGRILMVGGLSSSNRALAGVQIYDPERNVWMDAAPLRTGRFQHAAILLPGEQVLVTGGLYRSSRPLAGGEIYDPRADAWTPAPSMQVARYGHTLTALPDGRVIVMGGCHVKPLSSVEFYLPLAGA